MIAEMRKVQLAVPASREEELWRWLQDQELIQLTKLETTQAVARDAATDELEHQLAQVQFGLEFLARVQHEGAVKEKRSWRKLLAGKRLATLAELEADLDSLPLASLLERIRSYSDRLAEIRARRSEITDHIAELTPWQSLEITGAQLAGQDGSVRHFLVSVSDREEALVRERFEALGTLAWYEVGRVPVKKQQIVYWEVVMHIEQERSFHEVIAQTNAAIHTVTVPAEQTIAQAIEALTAEQTALDDEYATVMGEAQSLLEMREQLEAAYDTLLHRRDRIAAAQLSAHLPLTVVLEGWVPQQRLTQLEADLDEAFEAVALAEIEPAEGEEPPVAFANSRLIRPFEAVTDIYGKPKYHELDPSAVLSLFFLVAFGLALSDAGYGIVMMVVMGAALKLMQLGRDAKRMVMLLFYAGASTTVFGALMGGWFGVTLEELPASGLKDVLLAMKVIDPISQPLTLLGVAFAIGIVQLLFAWGVRAYDHARQKQFFAVIFDDVAWITMVVVLLAWAAASLGYLPASLEQLLLMGTLANAAVLVATQGRSFKNPLLKLGAGILSLYGLVSFLSDTLSYSRLLALGLATGIIALVVNLLGSMITDALPGIAGIVVAAVVLLGGHVFNLGINALGAFIHSGRLQFVEFFPKFMEGGGAAFKPFGRSGRYVENPKNVS